jgi:hypothetical protein
VKNACVISWMESVSRMTIGDSVRDGNFPDSN